MKTMKTMMLLTAAALLTAACSSEEDVQQQAAPSGSGWSEYVTVTAGAPGSSDASAASSAGRKRVAVDRSNPQKSLWESGDQLTVWTGSPCSSANMSEHGFALTSGEGTGIGKFSGRLVSTSAPTSDTPLIAVIDNGSDAIDASAGSSVTADLSEQKGATAETAMDYELYYATSTNGERSFTFSHKMALVKWTIKVNGASDGDVCDIKLSGAGLKNSATLDPATGTLKVAEADGTITLKDVTLSAGNTELYVVLPPCTCSSGIKATLTMTGGSKTGMMGIGTLGIGSIALEGNKYYTAGPNKFSLLPVVDLGLPSGILWATCNVGAEKENYAPEAYGDFFAWGETTGYTSSTAGKTLSGSTYTGYEDRSFDWASYTKFGTYDSKASPDYGFTKYNNTSGPTTLDSSDDAATANWGSAWRMPTHAEFQELVANTVSEWGALNGVNGRYFYKKDGSGNKVSGTYIFLPAAGRRGVTHLGSQGTDGGYWSSSLYESNASYARYLGFSSGYSDMLNGLRYGGRSVRAVLVQ